jgi:hypothetical protein
MRRSILPLLVLMLMLQSCSTPVSQPATTVVVSPATVTLTIYFLDMNHYAVGSEPYEAAVTRTIPTPASLPEAVLAQLFQGPTEAELGQGLQVVLSGSTGFSKLTIENEIARVYLTGICNSRGATYTIANLIVANLNQFPEIQWIKIYDQNGETETPDGQVGSIPFCLEP